MRTRTNRAVVRTLTNGVGPVHHHGNSGASRLGGENVSDSCPGLAG